MGISYVLKNSRYWYSPTDVASIALAIWAKLVLINSFNQILNDILTRSNTDLYNVAMSLTFQRF
jgi:hypothetical protein